MGTKQGNIENEKDSQFQEDLSKWFQNQGIIADLRSHLRYLMISALQRRESTTKFSQGTLKTQALNLLIAEYLFRLECHYTLSIFASEVPALSGFSCLAPFFKHSFGQNSSIMGFFEKQLPSSRNKFKKIFKENEIQEIFNALGFLLNSEEMGLLKNAYFKSCNETSLLEILISSFLNTSCKLNIPKISEGSHNRIGKDDLSDQWSSEVKNLLREQIKEPQLSAFYNSLVSITENEIRKLLEKEHLHYVDALRDRENRIRENLMKYEKDITIRLSDAKNDLIMRKNLIDKKLTEKQKVLFKMVLEWKSKHEEIMEVSKQFFIKRDEYRTMQTTLGEMQKKINYYEQQEIKQNEKINKLKGQIKLLVNKIKTMTEYKNTISNLFEEFMNKENVSGVNIPEKVEEKESHVETYRSPSENSSSPISLKNKSGNVSCCSLTSEEILLNARDRLQVLEEESLKINKNYRECKNKYCDNSDSETSKCFSSDSAHKDVDTSSKTFDKENTCVLLQKKLKANKKRKKSGIIYHLSSEQMKDENGSTKDFENFSLAYSNFRKTNLKDRKEQESIIKPPSQRQLKNRECFFKSKQLLQELESQQLVEELLATTTSFSTAGSSSETFNEQVNLKINTTEPLSPLEMENVSIYCRDKVSERESKAIQESEENINETYDVIPQDSNCLVNQEDPELNETNLESRL